MERNGWRLFAHPAFSSALDKLIAEVERAKRRDPAAIAGHPKAKLLRRILDLALEEIPANPNDARFQLGNTLGSACRHWRRAKFFQRFRLFYRFSQEHKVIVYAWMNDENALRSAGARDDPYELFKARLRKGQPPDGWDDLIDGAKEFDLPSND